jgi:Cof subfamily protein (haloacid dehalogenase superfamily)
MKRKISVFIADVDGTLLTPEKKLTRAALIAVEKLKDSGIKLVLTSGRPARGLRMIQRDLHLKPDSLIAAFNGALLVRGDFSKIEEHTLLRSQSERVVKLIEELGLKFWFYTGADWIVPDPSSAEFRNKEEHTVQFKPKIVSNYRPYLENVYKIVAMSNDYDLVARAEKEVQKEMNKEVSAKRSQLYYLDISHPLANKGAVVEKACRHFNVSQENVATIGDMPSDVLMFKKSGLSIAMGNASAEVKSNADEVTDSNEDDGFAHAVENCVLPAAGASDHLEKEAG